MRSKIDRETFCICQHKRKVHFPLDIDDRGNRAMRHCCGQCKDDIWIHPFKMDNLKYLEDKYVNKK